MNKTTLQAKIRKEPEWFLQEVLGVQYWDKSLEIINSVRDNRRTSVSGCTGSSKTYTAACLIAWWLASYSPARVVTFAPGFRQVLINVWGYLKTVVRSSRKPLGGKLLESVWQIRDDVYAMGFSTDAPERLHGIHGPNDLIILDDAHGIPWEIFEALENVMANGRARVLLLFNKNTLAGEAYDSCHSKAHLYNHVPISAFDTPNVKAAIPVWEKLKKENPNVQPRELLRQFQKIEAQTIKIDGMIVYSQALEWIDTYGWDSNKVRVYVRDLFPKQEADTLIPNDWIEAAMVRDVKPEGMMVLGVDPARQGDDRTVIASMKGRVVFTPEVYPFFTRSTFITGKVIAASERLNSRCSFVDVIGFGGGVVDELVEAKRQVVGVNVAEKSEVLKNPSHPEHGFKFANKRAELWWTLREALDPDNEEAIKLPKDQVLRGELSSIKYEHNSKGEIVVESKDDMKKRLNRSPDIADAVGLAVYGQKYLGGQGRQPIVTVMTIGDEE